MNKLVMSQISQISLALRLPAFRKEIETVIKEALAAKQSHEQVILELLKKEQELRAINRKKVQMRNACFPQLKYLEDLCRPELPEDAIAKLPDLETLDFIKAGKNVILGGSPGTGYVKRKIM